MHVITNLEMEAAGRLMPLGEPVQPFRGGLATWLSELPRHATAEGVQLGT